MFTIDFTNILFVWKLLKLFVHKPNAYDISYLFKKTWNAQLKNANLNLVQRIVFVEVRTSKLKSKRKRRRKKNMGNKVETDNL